MTNHEVNTGRRRFLTATTAVVGAVGAGFAAVPFIKSWSPSARARFAGAPVSQDLSALAEGQQLVINWRGQPIFIAKRSKAMLETMKSLDSLLADPGRRTPTSSPSTRRTPRARSSRRSRCWSACAPTWAARRNSCRMKPEPFDPDWKGGYFCPCHKSRFDMAGRVFQGVPAPTNLPVPPYYFENDTTIVIGR
jgi:ubiquinol-cytochrome c reductase iron-sulfur subunit